MKTIEIKAYEFNELSDKAKEKARDWYREHVNCGDTGWSECTIEEAVTQGNLMGITFKERRVPLMSGKTRGEPCIYWSGFSCQGDGACFEGTWRAGDVQADKVADGWGDDPATTEIKRIASVFGEIAKEWPTASFAVTHRGRYYHEYCTEFDVMLDEDPDMVWDYAVVEELIETARDFMKWIYRQLEKEYEYRNSDECVDEEIEANEYLFTEDGKRSTVL
jgi:hypothetical protein